MNPETKYRRLKDVFSVMLVLLILPIATVLGAGSPASAADLTLDLPAGIACEFDLRIEILLNVHRPEIKQFSDKNGNIVRIISPGKGNALSFTNLDTEATFSLKADGSVSHTKFNPDGSQTVAVTGHNVMVWFSTDTPSGPSTIQYVGRMVYAVDTDGVFTLQEVSGRTTDICAALSK